jgi:hypothetical protein
MQVNVSVYADPARIRGATDYFNVWAAIGNLAASLGLRRMRVVLDGSV